MARLGNLKGQLHAMQDHMIRRRRYLHVISRRVGCIQLWREARRASPHPGVHLEHLPRPFPRPIARGAGLHQEQQPHHHPDRQHLLQHCWGRRVPRHRVQGAHRALRPRGGHSCHRPRHNRQTCRVRHKLQTPFSAATEMVHYHDRELGRPLASSTALIEEQLHERPDGAGLDGLDAVPAPEA
uniref:Uncharacterized protein n=1 Tax=Triticum urartu TaxID=4572 RepID=A0A8R7PFM5_TRIUA